MINDTEEINVVIQDTDSVTVTEGTPTDIAEIMHNEEIRQENEAQRIENENQRIANETSREEYINDLKQRVEDGEFDGEDGFSPTANVLKNEDTATITITDKNGTTTAEISDGTDGVDGVSPVVSMEKQGKVTTLTITDATGTHTTEIRDGNDGSGTGDMLKATYDTNDNGIVDNAEKVNNHTVESDVPSGLDTILNNKQDIMQYSTMPTASATYEDKIVQYIGTTGTYTNGYFYICTEDSGTYSWTNINVQNPGLPSDLARIYTCDTFTGSTSGDLFDACKQVYEDYTNGINSALYVHISTDTANTTNGFYIYYYDSTYGFHKLTRTENKTIINQTSSYSQITESGGVIDLTITNGEVVRINPGISTGQAARYVLEVGKDYSTPYTPQYNGSPATKKYVDDKFMYQRDTMPTASSDFYNKIFQYIGTTNANYTNGYFYKCVRNGTSPNYTYSWERLDVQPSFSGNYNDLTNKPTIPDELADLSDDATHRLVTDTEKTTWSDKQDALVSGTNIKTINNTSILGSGDIEVGADIPQQDTAPSNPQEDDLWIDTDDNTNLVEIDSTVSTTSTNPIENQAITNYVDSKSLDIYSADEVRIGTWIDGKPIYRKIATIDAINSSGNSKQTSVATSNLKEFVNITGVVANNSGGYKPLNSLYISSSGIDAQYTFQVYAVNNAMVEVVYGNWWKTNFKKAYVILEYTKTTD